MKLKLPKDFVLKDVHININEKDKDSFEILSVGHHEPNFVACPLQGADIKILKDIVFDLFEEYLDKNNTNFGGEYEDMDTENGTLVQYVEISDVIRFKI
jgi:hypothetical protein